MKNVFEKIGCYFVSFFWSIKGIVLKTEVLQYHPQDYAILLLAFIFGFPQGLAALAQADKGSPGS